MIDSGGRPALALSQSGVPGVANPAWLRGLTGGLVADGGVSGVAAVVGGPRRVRAAAAAGEAETRSGGSQPLFDLASLSKPWTASLALRLDGRGLLPLATELAELWPGCDRRLARRTLEDLLRHRGGLVPWAPLYRHCRRRRTVAAALVGGRLLGARRGTYSDLGYVLWGLSAERALGRSLGDLLLGEVVSPLGLCSAPAKSTFWLPCGLGNEREVDLAAALGVKIARSGPAAAGRVQDGNARFLGAPAGHAGLFATPGAVFALAREWLTPGALWTATAVAGALGGGGPFALGWRRATKRGSGGPALGADAFGHVGFTGGSVWVDPGRRRIMILLAHRSRVEIDMAPARRRFHALALPRPGSA